jgi:D-tyrosyl-tRNA(Tyr) deacylase
MVALVQRVREASVSVDGEVVGAIGAGVLVLLGVHRADSPAEADWLSDKVAALRIFDDPEGRMNLSLRDTAGAALVVSQFTLYGDTSRGNRPSYSDAAPPELAEPLYGHFVRRLEAALGRPVATGRFRAMMDVALVNDGPVTLWIERPPSGVEVRR